MRALLFALTGLLLAGYLAGQSPPDDRRVVEGISSPEYTEFAPTISGDGRTMVFESDRSGEWKLYESDRSPDGKWSEPVPITSVNEACVFLAGPSLSSDGNALYYTAYIEGVTESEDIYYSKRGEGDTWSEPISVGAPINTSGYEGFPSISADGHSLYFLRTEGRPSGNRRSRESCFTIYVSHKGTDGRWAEPAPLPPRVNIGCERDPRIMADNHTLIFSSIRTGGKGKFDLYQSKLVNEGTWTEPVPLDFVNTPENDQSPCISAAGETMYYYSRNDIYSITVPESFRQLINITFHGRVYDENTNKVLPAEIQLSNITKNRYFRYHNDPTTGEYSLVLGAGNSYTLDFTSPGYMSKGVTLDLSRQARYEEVERSIALTDRFPVQVMVVDKDLQVPVTSFVSVVRENGEVTFRDSVKNAAFPLVLTLRSEDKYMVSAAAKEYAPAQQLLEFDPTVPSGPARWTLHLAHEKIELVPTVISIKSKSKTNARVYFSNEGQDEVIIAEAGDTVLLRKGDRYQVVTSSDKGYIFSSTSLVAGTLSDTTEAGVHQLELAVIPIEKGAELTLNHIRFETNSAMLNSSSFVELDRVVELLQSNPNITIEISAHTDDVGGDSFNLRLSQQRALSTVEYLRSKGADERSIEYTGYGKRRPLVPNDSEEHRAMNRRVELRILRIK
jgi:outer membrane protein OmpA-like peptidoglycan-associated protein